MAGALCVRYGDDSRRSHRERGAWTPPGPHDVVAGLKLMRGTAATRAIGVLPPDAIPDPPRRLRPLLATVGTFNSELPRLHSPAGHKIAHAHNQVESSAVCTKGANSAEAKEKFGGRGETRTPDPLLANSKSEFGWRWRE